MMKRWVLIGIAALLFWGPSVAHEQQAPPDHKHSKAQNAPQPVPPTHVIIDPSPAVEHVKAEPDNSQNQPPDKPLPRFARPEWVIVYITAIYVLIAGLTLRAIKKQSDWMKEQTGRMTRQADLMNRQNVIGLAAARAAQSAAKAAESSVEIFVGKERPRLSIKPGFFYANFFSKGSVCTLTLYISNLGPANARDVSLHVSILTDPKEIHPSLEKWQSIDVLRSVKPTKQNPEVVHIRFVYERDLQEQFDVQSSFESKVAALPQEAWPATWKPGFSPLDSRLFPIDIRGVFKYSGISPEPHELWFRYIYVENSVRLAPAFSKEHQIQWQPQAGRWIKTEDSEENRET